jgi:hypothetical protein
VEDGVQDTVVEQQTADITEPGTGNAETQRLHVDDQEGEQRFRRIFLSKLRRLEEYDTMNRRHLKIPKSISTEVWSWSNRLVDKYKVSRNGKSSLKRINRVVYAIGETIISYYGEAETKRKEERNAWFRAQNDEVISLRRHIGWITSELDRRLRRTDYTATQWRNYSYIRRKFGIRTRGQLESKLESLKARLKITANRINLRLADENRRAVRHAPAREVLKGNLNANQLGSADDARAFWQKIIGSERVYEKTDSFRRWEQVTLDSVQKMRWSDTALDLKKWDSVVKKSKARKAPGPDGIPGIMWKRLGSANREIFDWLMKVKEAHKLRFPPWLTKGRIVLLPKEGNLKDPSNYRPIACLNTCYKLVTGLFARWIEEQINTFGIIPECQLALRKRIWGVTQAQLLDRTLVLDAKKYNKQLFMCFVDCAKAFDSVSLLYLDECLKTVGLPISLLRSIKHMMQGWSVRYEVGYGRNKSISQALNVKNGVLQGDTLSPLLFCLAMAPVAYSLDELGGKYRTYTRSVRENPLETNQLWYMDDLKLYCNSRNSLRSTLQHVKTELSSISLRINPKKCAIVTITPLEPGDVGIENVRLLGEQETYKYLGLEQKIHVDESIMWERLTNTMTAEIVKLAESNLLAGQMIKGINGIVMPKARFLLSNMVAGSWKVNECRLKCEHLDTEIRLKLAECKFRYRTACKVRLYLPPEDGGLGLVSVEDLFYAGVCYAWAYAYSRDDFQPSRRLFKVLKGRSTRTIDSDMDYLKKKFDLIGKIEVKETDGGRLITVDGQDSDEPTQIARRIVKLIQSVRRKQRLDEWLKLSTASRIVTNAGLDQRLTHLWLKQAAVGKLAMRNCIAVQEDCLFTRAKTVSREAQNTGECRRCHRAIETPQHVASGCDFLRSSIMTERHNSVALVLHRGFCVMYGFARRHYTKTIPRVLERGDGMVKLYWDVRVETPRAMRHNRPDIVVFDKIRRVITVIEFSVSWFSILHEKEMQKYHKYATNSCDDLSLVELPPTVDINLRGQLEALHVDGKTFTRVDVVSIAVGTCGEITTGTLEKLVNMGFKQKVAASLIVDFQRAAIAGTSRVIRAHMSI